MGCSSLEGSFMGKAVLSKKCSRRMQDHGLEYAQKRGKPRKGHSTRGEPLPGMPRGRLIMKTHNFTIIASGASSAADDEIADRLFEIGCDDATLSLQKAVLVLEFERAARTFTTALVSAVRDVERAGLQVERIEPEFSPL